MCHYDYDDASNAAVAALVATTTADCLKACDDRRTSQGSLVGSTTSAPPARGQGSQTQASDLFIYTGCAWLPEAPVGQPKCLASAVRKMRLNLFSGRLVGGSTYSQFGPASRRYCFRWKDSRANPYNHPYLSTPIWTTWSASMAAFVATKFGQAVAVWRSREFVVYRDTKITVWFKGRGPSTPYTGEVSSSSSSSSSSSLSWNPRIVRKNVSGAQSQTRAFP